jgi:hypothetical protein
MTTYDKYTHPNVLFLNTCLFMCAHEFINSKKYERIQTTSFSNQPESIKLKKSGGAIALRKILIEEGNNQAGKFLSNFICFFSLSLKRRN